MSNNSCAVILAGGQGKRMKSELPKPMFEVLGEPMLEWVMTACERSDINDLCVVTGYNAEVIENYVDGRCKTVYQPQRMGTGHAVMMAVDWLKERPQSNVFIVCGDSPFIDSETITAALEQHIRQDSAVTIITAKVGDPKGYGRILRGQNGVIGIVEEKDSTDEQKKINEIGSGAYWFKSERLIEALNEIKPNNSQGEYYLTDSVYILINHGFRADAYIAPNSDVVLGANDRKGLLMLNNTARNAVIDKLLADGVEFTCTDGVTIGRNVTVGAGTKILQGTIIRGDTVIGENCVIGPNCLIEDCIIGSGVTLNSVQAYKSQIDDNAKIGPFVHIRPDSHIMAKVKIGDFVEVKNSTVGERTSISHLTYVGDSDVGSNVNFGCGVVTVNYDGEKKHRISIDDNAFIGCNTNLISPVKVGKSAYTAAGTTVTKDVPDGALAIERGELHFKDGFGDKRLKLRNSRK